MMEASDIDPKRWPPRMLGGVISRWKDRGLPPEKVDLAEASPDSLRAQLKALQEEVGSLREENERLRQASPKGGGKRRGGAAAKAEVSAHTEER